MTEKARFGLVTKPSILKLGKLSSERHNVKEGLPVKKTVLKERRLWECSKSIFSLRR